MRRVPVVRVVFGESSSDLGSLYGLCADELASRHAGLSEYLGLMPADSFARLNLGFGVLYRSRLVPIYYPRRASVMRRDE